MSDHNPGRERQRLTDLYAGMTDAELEKLAGEALTLSDTARETLTTELSRRNLRVTPQDSLQEEKDEHPPLVTLRTYMNVPEALLAKSILDSAEIQCFLADESIIRLDWFLSNALGGVKLLVRQEDVESASALPDRDHSSTRDTDPTSE